MQCHYQCFHKFWFEIKLTQQTLAKLSFFYFLHFIITIAKHTIHLDLCDSLTQSFGQEMGVEKTILTAELLLLRMFVYLNTVSIRIPNTRFSQSSTWCTGNWPENNSFNSCPFTHVQKYAHAPTRARTHARARTHTHTVLQTHTHTYIHRPPNQPSLPTLLYSSRVCSRTCLPTCLWPFSSLQQA